MKVRILFALLVMCLGAAAFVFGVRFTVIETTAGNTLRDIVYDGGPIQQVWTGFSGTFSAYVGTLAALFLLGLGAAFSIYLVFLLALKLFAKLVNDAVKTVIYPITQAVNVGKGYAAGASDFAKGGVEAVKDRAGRAAVFGGDVAKAGIGNAVAAKDAAGGFIVAAANNFAGLRTPKQEPIAAAVPLQLGIPDKA